MSDTSGPIAAPVNTEQLEKIEKYLRWISIGALILGGAIFIYEGVRYIRMRQRDPKLPSKLNGAGAAAIVLGSLSIIFGVIHIWW